MGNSESLETTPVSPDLPYEWGGKSVEILPES